MGFSLHSSSATVAPWHQPDSDISTVFKSNETTFMGGHLESAINNKNLNFFVFYYCKKSVDCSRTYDIIY